MKQLVYTVLIIFVGFWLISFFSPNKTQNERYYQNSSQTYNESIPRDRQYDRLPRSGEIDYSTFIDYVQKDKIISVLIIGREITGRLDNSFTFKTHNPGDPELIKELLKHKVIVKSENPPVNQMGIIMSFLPMILIIGFIIWMIKRNSAMGGLGKGGPGGMTNSRATLNQSHDRVMFSDVAGIDEAKQEVEEIVDFLRDPYKFTRIGGKVPKGTLLIGQPGTGKTMLAKAIAGEAGVPFFTISGSDFVEVFVGVGASRVRDMFNEGKKNAPCIIFIDEIDAIGRKRGAGLGGGHDEREQTLNQLLVEMDGFKDNTGIILIAATNRPDILDPALLRPGRFDRQVIVPTPDVNGREKILKVHLGKVKTASNIDAMVIARGTPGFTGADLANIVNEAALKASKENQTCVTMENLEFAKDKIMMGSERRSLVMTDEEKKLTAYHEAGHTVVSLAIPENDPVHKVTIIPRGRALGLTMSLPERDHLGYKKSELLARIAMMYGGRVAEELIFGKDDITTGAGNDIKQATQLAKKMVTEFGMSDKLGPVSYADNEEVFLGNDFAKSKGMSEVKAAIIDEEITRILKEGENTARKILDKQNKKLHRLAKALLKHETLNGEEIKLILAGKSINKKKTEKAKTNTVRKTKSSIPISTLAKEIRDEI